MDAWMRKAQRVVDVFAAGWRDPRPNAWDDVLADDLRLAQPLLRTRTGKQALAEEYARLFALVPDLRGTVDSWEADPDTQTVTIRLRLSGTLGRGALEIPVTDNLRLDSDGRIAYRHAEFEVLPAVLRLLREPRAWRRWWRSGVGPLLDRRALLPGDPEHVTTPPLLRHLSRARLILAAATGLAPRLPARLLGLDAPRSRALRSAALALGTLTSTGAQRRRWQALALSTDLTDVATARGRVRVLAAAFALADVVALGLDETS